MEMLGILFERYSTMVFGVCMKYLSEPADGEDATMAIFEILTDKLKTHDIGVFRGWLYVVTKNHCLQILRAKRGILTEDLEHVHMYSDLSAHPIDKGDAWQQDGLKSCLNQLSPAQKQSIELFYFESKTYEEIADEMVIEKDLVRSHIQNGRRNLRKCMEQKSHQQEFKE
jgi:RNA polymerase sigma-70 factor (ECF subfamily)